MSGEETVEMIEDQYAKILAIVMWKHRLFHVQLSIADIESADKSGKMNLAVQEIDGVFHIKIVTTNEAQKLAKMEELMKNKKPKP